MANIKVSDMTALTSLPDDAIFYVVLPDGSYGKVTKLELLSGVVAGTTPTLQLVTDEGAQTDKSMTIRNDILDRFLAVAKGSKDIQMYADRLSHTSNGESSTQMVFAPTLIPSEIQVRNLSGTMALLSDISAVLEGIAWKQPVELNLDSGVTLSGSIPTITSLTQQGVTLVDDSRVIVSGLANQIFNGIYRVNSTLVSGTYRLYRTDDANTPAELNNAVVGVTGGAHAGKTFRQSTLNPDIGTSNIVFQDFGSAVANATDVLAGISKLYNAVGTETDGGVTPNAVLNALNNLNPLVKRLYFDDFVNLGDNGVGVLIVSGGTFQTDGGLSSITKIGAGTQFTKMPSELNRDGILRATIGNINGNIRIRHSNLWIKSTDSVAFSSSFRIQTLSTALERYALEFRFFNDNNNFISARYSDNVNSGNFQFITSLASVTTIVNTSVNVAINTWYELEIRIINGIATLFINGVAQTPISTNILLNASYDAQWYLVKTTSSANAARTIDFDYLLFKDL